jgi:hypothetical protein
MHEGQQGGPLVPDKGSKAHCSELWFRARALLLKQRLLGDRIPSIRDAVVVCLACVTRCLATQIKSLPKVDRQGGTLTPEEETLY